MYPCIQILLSSYHNRLPQKKWLSVSSPANQEKIKDSLDNTVSTVGEKYVQALSANKRPQVRQTRYQIIIFSGGRLSPGSHWDWG